MRPPFVARALIAAATPPLDYASVAGDLCEEYNARVESAGRPSADRWYWAQVARSIPALLSYSRAHRSFAAKSSRIAIVLIVLFAMLFCKDMIDRVIDLVDPRGPGLPAWLYFAIDWTDAALFGGILAAIVRSAGMRLALVASVALVAAFALPVILGISPPLQTLAWFLLLGAVPAMAVGAAVYQVLRRRESGSI